MLDRRLFWGGAPPHRRKGLGGPGEGPNRLIKFSKWALAIWAPQMNGLIQVPPLILHKIAPPALSACELVAQGDATAAPHLRPRARALSPPNLARAIAAPATFLDEGAQPQSVT